MLVFFFSGLAIKAVGKAADVVIQDVRAQFKEHPGIMQGTEKPDYGRTVDIVTRGALRQMIAPGLVAVGTPIVVGLIFKQFGVGAEAVAALLMVGTIAGVVMATFLNNGGGAWDNAKKYIETGGAYGGKGSPDPQGGRRRRHRGRPLQGHRRPVAARAHQAARDDHPGARAAVHLTGEARQRPRPSS